MNVATPFRWGIASPGNIASSFATDAVEQAGHRITACASSTQGKAEAFSTKFPGCRALATLEELAQDPEVDAVYIASTHNFHFEQAKRILNLGKPVLCEKPFTVNARQAEELVEISRSKRVFLMEAWWTRFLPSIEGLLSEIASGTIGRLRLVQVDFGIKGDWSTESRMVNPALAGGALLDLGVYPVGFALLLFGSAPKQAIGVSRNHATGVDAQSTYLLDFQGGHAVITSSLDLEVPLQARIYGTKGQIIVEQFFHPTSYVVQIKGQADRLVEFPQKGIGYQYEALEVEKCLLAGQTESPKRPLADTLAVMKTLDRLRACWGLTYPDEK